jgi:hypothetical protein
MSYVVEVERHFRVRQGLPSPVRTANGRPRIEAATGVDLTVTAGVAFEDDQLTARGWFFDTDAAADELDHACADLAVQRWTDLFDFRPTFELVARHVFDRLAPRMPQLAFVELYDESFGSRTRYRPPAAQPDPAGAARDPAGAARDPAGAARDPAGAARDPAGAARDPGRSGSRPGRSGR